MSETDSCVYKRRKFQKFDVAFLSEDAVGGSDKAIENGNTYDRHHLEDLIGTPYIKQINLTAESMGDFHSTKELCVFVLKSHGLLGVTSESVSFVSLEDIDVLTSKSNLLCKLCCQSGSPSGMLICDLCEEAFHINCLNPKINKIPIDEWNCQPCLRSKPNVKSGNSYNLVDELPEQGLSIYRGDLSSVAFILQDKLPYTTGVRIGKDFQAEVPEWSYFVNNEVDNFEYFSLHDVVAESMGDFRSTKELCIFVLKSHGLLTSESVSCVSLEDIDVLTSKSNLLCKLCCQSGSPSGMLICDLCEEAFHINCLNHKINKIPIDEWNCQPCLRSKANVKSGNSYNLVDEQDKLPYTTGVRIGKDFQAEVPEWSGLVLDEEFHPFEELSEVDFAECSSLTASNSNKQPKTDSMGNWIQCCEIVYSGDDDERTICGKWRRNCQQKKS